ncbi:MAG: HemK/PrmC family methyltransferase [Candidatus Paceibacterota bacterium]
MKGKTKISELEKDCAILLREKYKGKQTSAFWRDVGLLMKGELLDYVIGWRPFLGTKIDLEFRPLIPRDETEFWVEKVLADLAKDKEFFILDVFCGSGCIGIAALKSLKKAKVIFADIDPFCLMQTAKNIKLNKIGLSRAAIKQSDILQDLEGGFDYIFANPPYIPEIFVKDVQDSVLRHESGSFLFGGKDGLQYIRKLLVQAKKHLKPGGRLFCEFDSRTVKDLRALLKKEGYKAEICKDQFKKPRYFIAAYK